jgi:plastocyanin
VTRGAIAIVVTALLLFSAGCGSSSKKTRPVQPALDWRGRSAVDIDATDNLFTPPNIIISPGTKVTWHNKGAVAHNIQKATDLLDFGAPFGVGISAFGPGASYSFTFKKVGTLYSYACTIHTDMSGHVDVETGTPATTTP